MKQKEDKTYHMVATCPDELTEVVAKELENCGAENIRTKYRAVTFLTNENNYYKCHLKLRTASSLLRVIAKINSINLHHLEKEAKKIQWTNFIVPNKSFRVDVSMADKGKDLPSSNAISRAIRIAVEHAFYDQKLKKPNVSIKEPNIIIHAFFSRKGTVISFNTSGRSLHKRGYRHTSHPAPLQETVAASLLQLCQYSGSEAFYDPMCGSGTIAIEAAYLALNKSSQIHRKKGLFGFEHLKDFNTQLWRDTQEEARTEKRESPPQKIYASDINPIYLDETKQNALRARVEKNIDFKCCDFFKSTKPEPSGVLVCNLPYGKRLNEIKNLEEFYKNVGDHLKKNFTGWKACLLVDEESPWKKIGLRTSKKFNLKNGSIKSKFFIYDLYEGSKKIKKENDQK